MNCHGLSYIAGLAMYPAIIKKPAAMIISQKGKWYLSLDLKFLALSEIK